MDSTGFIVIAFLALLAVVNSEQGDYFYSTGGHYVDFQRAPSSTLGSQQSQSSFQQSSGSVFPTALGFRGTPPPSYQQERYLPSAYQLPPQFDPYLHQQVRTNQAGFHTNQHLPQPFHPQTNRGRFQFGATGSDYEEDLTSSLGARGSSVAVNSVSGFQEPPAPPSSVAQPPHRPGVSIRPLDYQELVRSTAASYFQPGPSSSLVDQLDSNRWRASQPPSVKRKPQVSLPLQPELAYPNVLSSTGFLNSIQQENSTPSTPAPPTTRGRTKYKNLVRQPSESTSPAPAPTQQPKTVRTRRPTPSPRTSPPRTRPTTTSTTTTTESPHYDPDYELEYILEPDESLDESLSPSILDLEKSNFNNVSSNDKPLIPSIKFQEALNSSLLPPGFVLKDTTSTPAPTTRKPTPQPVITTYAPKLKSKQPSTVATKRPALTTKSAPVPQQSTTSPLISLETPTAPSREIEGQSESPTESWVVVASVHTSRSVSGARFLPDQVVKQEEIARPLSSNGTIEKNVEVPSSAPAEISTESPASTSSQPSTSASSRGSTESIIEKLDRLQSELSSGISVAGFRPSDAELDIPDVTENKTSSSTAPPSTTLATTTTTTTPSTTTTTTASATSRETEPPRRFVPTGKRTTIKPKKSLIESIKFDELGPGLLPPGFKSREFKPKSTSSTNREGNGRSSGSTFKNKVKDEKNDTSKNLESVLGKITFEDVSSLLPAGYNPSEVNTTAEKVPEITLPKDFKVKPIVKTSVPASLLPPGFKPPVKDDIPESLLPPGFKLNKTESKNAEPVEAILKKVEFKDVSALLPPGFKANGTSEKDPLAGLLPPGFKIPSPTEAPSEESSTTTEAPGKVVFPTRPGGRKPPPSRTKSAGGLSPVQPKIQKGWPVRATTEFTGWPTPSTTPMSVEKILEQARQNAAKIAAYNEKATSTDAPITSSTPSTTTTTTTTRRPTTPGICTKDCDMAATLRLMSGVKWVPELLDHNTLEWQQLANEVESQLEAVYSSSDSLSKWYKKITIDAFSQGSVLVDYFVELTDLGRTVNTADMKRLFHESLAKYTASQAALSSDSAPSTSNNQTEYRLGKYTIDPNYTDFIVLPRQVLPTVGYAEEDELLPQWAIAVIVIGLASLLFVIIFGVTVLVNRHKSSKKKQPTVLTEDMLHELNKNHMGGLDNFGADDLYNMEDVWGDKPVKQRSSGSIQENSMANLYDSWRSEWNGYYYNAYYGGNNGSSSGYGMSRRRSDYDTNF